MEELLKEEIRKLLEQKEKTYSAFADQLSLNLTIEHATVTFPCGQEYEIPFFRLHLIDYQYTVQKWTLLVHPLVNDIAEHVEIALKHAIRYIKAFRPELLEEK